MDNKDHLIAGLERIFVPVSKKCNVQCNFCDRKHDCCNAGKYGQISSIISVDEVENYLQEAFTEKPDISAIEVAGVAEPFATPVETLNIVSKINELYPDKFLCITSNGLEIAEYAERLAQLNVVQVSIAVNAVKPIVGAEIYEWIYYKKKTLFGVEAATVLIERQKIAVEALKKQGVSVKINTVVIPKVNENHIEDIAEQMAKLGADMQDCLLFYPVEGTEFSELFYSNTTSYSKAMLKAAKYLPQVSPLYETINKSQTKSDVAFFSDKTEIKKIFKQKPNIAVCTTDGKYVDLHLGAAPQLWIYTWKNDQVELLEKRPVESNIENRWDALASKIPDCHYLLVAGVGGSPLQVLDTYNIETIALEGSIAETLKHMFQGNNVPEEQLKRLGKCGFGSTCSGPGPRI